MVWTKNYSLFNEGLNCLLAQSKPNDSARLFVTPNLDHIRLLGRSRSFRKAYASADFIINDSRVLDRFFLGGRALCIPGADWVPLFLERQPDAARVAVIGYAENVRAYLQKRFAKLALHFIQPSMGFIRKRNERRRIVSEIAEIKPALVLVCTGAPQSEVFSAQLKSALMRMPVNVVCCGSTLRFLSNPKLRAPAFIRRMRAEWLWRFITEPHTRLRYVADGIFLGSNLGRLYDLRTVGTARFSTFSISCRVGPEK